jgi:uncharacterized protein (DUF305 family)
MTSTTSTRRPRRTAAALALTAVVTLGLLSACGGDEDKAETAPQAQAQAEFNDADVTFAQSMIPHHEQAVAMAELAASRAKSAAVKDLAAKILAAQGPEIDTMKDLLTDWGKPTEPDMAGMDHSTMSADDMAAMSAGHDMPGMATSKEVAELRAAKGAAFDRAFLDLMIAHHRGAIEMAAEEQSGGRSPAAKDLAGRIVTTQRSEVARMQDLAKKS